MKIQFAGTGGAFQTGLRNSSALLTMDSTTFLIDCGHSVFPYLVERNLIQQIDAVIVTHLHDDHVGSLSSLILFNELALKKGRMKLIYPSEAFRIQLTSFLSHSLGDPEEWVEFIHISKVEGMQAVDTFGKHVPGMQTWSFLFSDGKSSIAYSGDLGDPSPLFEALEQLDLPVLRVFHETCFIAYGTAHVLYTELEKYLDRYDIYGYHCDHREKPEGIRLKLVADFPELLA